MSDASPQLSVIIPAFNEERRLPRTLDEVLGYLTRQPYQSEVLVVDDGCDDGTARLVRERAATLAVPLAVIAHPDGRNHGKGAAVRRGMLAAHGRYRLFMDADNSTAIAHLDSFWPFFDSGCDAVIGSRDVAGADVALHQSWYRELAGKLGNLVIQLLAVPGIHDTQTGFKMFSERCVADVFPRLTIDRWGFDVEILAVCRARGYRVQELPVRWVNQPDSKLGMGSYFEVLGEVWRVRRNLRAGRYR
ncbi:MAG: glycosyltransferase family 2 protein [Deltaproteobacteria bacterium]|nr:glycosyltransferase family 2 protein [Deltaproteobacteria bacterium]